MATGTEFRGATTGSRSEGTGAALEGDGGRVGPSLSTEQVWRAIAKGSFAIVGYTTPANDPRSSGVIYKVLGRRLFVAVAQDSWKAKHIPASGRVAVTVPVRRGGLLSLVAPIPPATISFHATARVHTAGSAEVAPLLKELAPLLPKERRSDSCIIEIVPEGMFVTYGIGVSLKSMRDPDAARGRVPVGRGAETR
jgi:hypothetical protein